MRVVASDAFATARVVIRDSTGRLVMLTGRKSLVGLFAIGMLVAGGISPAIAFHTEFHQLGEAAIDLEETPFLPEFLLGTQCPAFDHHMIDAASLVLNINPQHFGDVNTNAPIVLEVEDDSSIPSIRCTLITDGFGGENLNFDGDVRFSVDAPIGLGFDRHARLRSSSQTGVNTLLTGVTIHELSEQQAAACRNQALKSRMWQLYCAPELEPR